MQVMKRPVKSNARLERKQASNDSFYYRIRDIRSIRQRPSIHSGITEAGKRKRHTEVNCRPQQTSYLRCKSSGIARHLSRFVRILQRTGASAAACDAS